MKNILRIFKRDLKKTFTNWVAVVVIIGLMCLPAIYAWPNILASWDPYGNTQGIKVAVVNEDLGDNLGDKRINIGEELVNQLKDNDKLGWQFVDKEEGDKGVENGKYYATIVIPGNFTKDTLSIMSKDIEKPQIIYKVNQKINAIAPKITDKGVSAIKSQVDTKIIEAVDGVIFKVLNEAGIQIEGVQPTILKLVNSITNINEKMPEIEKLVNDAYDGTITASELMDKVNKNMPVIKDTLDLSSGLLGDTGTALRDSKEKINKIAPVVKEDLEGVNKALGLIESENGVPMLMKFINAIINLDSNMPEVEKLVDDAYNGTITAQELIDGINKNIPIINDTLDTSNSLLNDTKKALEDSKAGLNEIAPIIKEDLIFVNGTLKSIENIIDNLIDVNDSIDKDRIVESLDSISLKIVQLKDKIDAKIRILKPLSKFNPDLKKVVDVLTNISNKLDESNKAVNNIKNAVINGTITNKDKLIELKELISKNNALVSSIIDKYDTEYVPQINNAIDKMSKVTDNTLVLVNEAQGAIPKVSELLNKFNIGAELGENQLAKLKEDMPEIKEKLSSVASKLKEVSGEKLQQLISDNKAIIQEILDKYDTDYIPKINDAIDKLNKVIDNAIIIVNEAQTSMPQVNDLLGKLSSGVELGKNELAKLKESMPEIKEKVASVASKVAGLTDEEKVNEVLELLKNDWEKTSSFLASPVEIKEDILFPIPTYGSAMSPFYSTLSLWVGALILVSILTVDAHDFEGEEKLKVHEKYFGKFLLFAFIGVFQALIVSIGDMLLLKCYVVDPIKFVGISVFSSLVFVSIVYTMVSVFGNIGKAISIVLLVLQVAGAGGTFPIEITKPFFQNVNPFLPFTYAISAMRECVGGIVPEILRRDIIILFVYIVISVVIGLLLKKTVNKASKKFVDKLKESDLLGH